MTNHTQIAANLSDGNDAFGGMVRIADLADLLGQQGQARHHFYLTPRRLTHLPTAPYHKTATPFREVRNMMANREKLEYMYTGTVRDEHQTTTQQG